MFTTSPKRGFTISPKQKERKIFPSEDIYVEDTITKCWICNKTNKEVSLSLCSKNYGSHHINHEKKWKDAYKEHWKGSEELYSSICFDCAH